MNNKSIVINKNLDPNTKLYRYIKLSCFLELTEKKCIYLTNLNAWDDPWEFPAKDKIPKGFKNKLYGQCWSSEGISDALWKIYGKDKEGILIQTSVEKFSLIRDIKFAILSPVIYYNNLNLALRKIENINELEKIFYTGLLKRRAFMHEKEVRLITLNDDKYLNSSLCKNKKNLLIRINPLEFIENIYIDPRASNWFIDTMKTYCTNYGFKNLPIKSDLI